MKKIFLVGLFIFAIIVTGCAKKTNNINIEDHNIDRGAIGNEGDCCSCCPDLQPGESCIALCCPCNK